MATYKYQYDDTEMYTAANAACAKVTRVFKDGNGFVMFETSEDLSEVELAAVRTAVNAVNRTLEKEG